MKQFRVTLFTGSVSDEPIKFTIEATSVKDAIAKILSDYAILLADHHWGISIVEVS